MTFRNNQDRTPFNKKTFNSSLLFQPTPNNGRGVSRTQNEDRQEFDIIFVPNPSNPKGPPIPKKIPKISHISNKAFGA